MSEAVIPQLLTLAHIRRYFVPLSPSTLYEMISKGTFPAATVRIGQKIRLWHREDVETWINSSTFVGRKGTAHVA